MPRAPSPCRATPRGRFQVPYLEPRSDVCFLFLSSLEVKDYLGVANRKNLPSITPLDHKDPRAYRSMGWVLMCSTICHISKLPCPMRWSNGGKHPMTPDGPRGGGAGDEVGRRDIVEDRRPLDPSVPSQGRGCRPKVSETVRKSGDAELALRGEVQSEHREKKGAAYCRTTRSGLYSFVSPPPIGGPALLDAEADGPPRLLRWGHELADGVKHALELGVVTLLQFIKPPGEISIRGNHQLARSAPS